jgi:hypothetical protein
MVREPIPGGVNDRRKDCVREPICFAKVLAAGESPSQRGPYSILNSGPCSKDAQPHRNVREIKNMGEVAHACAIRCIRPPSGNKNICHATDFPQRLRVFLLHPAFQHGAVGPGTERRCWRGDLWRTSRNVARWEQCLVDFWTPVPAYLINQPRSYRKIHSSILQRWIG